MEKTVQNIPFLRISIALAIGIYLGNLALQIPSMLLILTILLLLIIAVIFKNGETFNTQIAAGLLFNLIFIVAGIHLFQSYNKKPQLHNGGYFTATVLETPQEKTNSFQSLAEINSFIRNDTIYDVTEKIIIYFKKEIEVSTLEPGNIILFKTNPQHIKNFGNPYEFDYKKYLERKKIYRQVYLDNNNWWKTRSSKKSATIIAENFRQKLLNIYKQLPINEKELEILSALTLGYKNDLDPDTKRVFSSAGAMHVLAVSGLHVGIVFWIIIILFGYLRKHKKGRIFFTIISAIILWGYAFITGLSPSVMRATTMFTIFIFGELLYRKANVYNSLSAAAFILLIITPNNLFDTGFQLSFSAVFGIVYLQPKISSEIKVENKVILFFWELLTVSVAAQIATLPFTLFYFGQFPTYFFITNIIIIPAIMILIPLGISILVISEIKILATLLSILINGLLKVILLLLTYIEQLPISVVNISITQIQQLLLISMVLTFFILLKSRRVIYIHIFLTCIVLTITTFIFQNISNLSKNEMIVYNYPENATIELIHGKSNFILSEVELAENASIRKTIDQTTQKRRLNPPIFYTLNDTVINRFIFLKNNIICFEGKTIFFGHQPNFDKFISPDFVINTYPSTEYNSSKNFAELIITNKKFNKNQDDYKNPDQHSTFETAFQKIW